MCDFCQQPKTFLNLKKTKIMKIYKKETIDLLTHIMKCPKCYTISTSSSQLEALPDSVDCVNPECDY